MSIVELIRLLVLVQRVAELIINAVVERQKAGNLETLQAAVSKYKEAKTDEERRMALADVRAAFRRQ